MRGKRAKELRRVARLLAASMSQSTRTVCRELKRQYKMAKARGAA